MSSNKNPRSGFRNTLSASIGCSREAEYQTWSRGGDSWPGKGQKSGNYVL